MKKKAETALSIDKLISIPIRAACDANIDIAKSIDTFIQTVGIDEASHVRTKDIIYQRLGQDRDKKPILEEIKLKVPMLSIVPVPNLQVEKADFEFCLEIKEVDVEQGEEDEKKGVQASVTSFKDNVRDTDNLPKCQVRIETARGEVPEGFARLLDVMNTAIVPERIVAKHLDDNGLPVEEDIEASYMKEDELSLRINQAYEVLAGLEQDYKSEKEQLLAQLNVELAPTFNIDSFYQEEQFGLKPYISQLKQLANHKMTDEEILDYHDIGKKINERKTAVKTSIDKLKNELRQAKISRIMKE